jgi:hypothetical protein
MSDKPNKQVGGNNILSIDLLKTLLHNNKPNLMHGGHAGHTGHDGHAGHAGHAGIGGLGGNGGLSSNNNTKITTKTIKTYLKGKSNNKIK